MNRDLVLRTERCVLHPLTGENVEDLHELWTHPQVRRYLWDNEVIPFEQTASIVQASARLFEKKGFGLWGAFDLENGELIGFCGYWYFYDPPELQILYGIAAAHWGKGYATELAGVVIERGFQVHGFERVAGATDVPNRASARVMEKVGMKLERRAMKNGVDTLFYAIERPASLTAPDR